MLNKDPRVLTANIAPREDKESCSFHSQGMIQRYEKIILISALENAKCENNSGKCYPLAVVEHTK